MRPFIPARSFKVLIAGCLLGAVLFHALPAAASEDTGVPAAAPAPAAPAAPQPPKKAEVPFREDAGLITAEYYLATGKYAQALQVIDNVLVRHPESADAYVYRGFAYSRLGDLRKAKDAYGRALTLNPGHLGANKYIADIYLQEGDLDRALEQMQVIRLTCGTTDCQEMDELDADINHYRQGQRENPAVKMPSVDNRYNSLNR